MTGTRWELGGDECGGFLVVEYLYSGDTVVAERANGGEWVYYGYGGTMYQQVANTGAEFKHWSMRGDLVATSGPSGAYLPAPLTDASGDDAFDRKGERVGVRGDSNTRS
jgi:hypothetical protein